MPLPISTVLVAVAAIALGFGQEVVAFSSLGVALGNETLRAFLTRSIASPTPDASDNLRTIQMQPDGKRVVEDPFGLIDREDED